MLLQFVKNSVKLYQLLSQGRPSDLKARSIPAFLVRWARKF